MQPDVGILKIYFACKKKIQDYLDRCIINLGSLFKFYGAFVNK